MPLFKFTLEECCYSEEFTAFPRQLRCSGCFPQGWPREQLRLCLDVAPGAWVERIGFCSGVLWLGYFCRSLTPVAAAMPSAHQNVHQVSGMLPECLGTQGSVRPICAGPALTCAQMCGASEVRLVLLLFVTGRPSSWLNKIKLSKACWSKRHTCQ